MFYSFDAVRGHILQNICGKTKIIGRQVLTVIRVIFQGSNYQLDSGDYYLNDIANMRRSIKFYRDPSPRNSGSVEHELKATNSIEELVRSSVELRQSLKRTECMDQKLILHTQLDRVERQLLKQLATQRVTKPAGL